MREHAVSLAEFAGVWRLSRQIDDRRGAAGGHFEGQARLTPGPDGAGLIYTEEGRLFLGDAPPLAAMRRFLWHPAGDGGIAVSFDDGRPFHRIRPGTLMPVDTHVCAADLYQVEYDFRDWPAWTVTWRVVGPLKDYTLRSRYARDTPAP